MISSVRFRRMQLSLCRNFPGQIEKKMTINLHSNRIGCLPSASGTMLPLHISYIVAMGIDGRVWGFRTFVRAIPSRIAAKST